ncbi:MAG: phosphatidylserine/phosphatidylglycerophosphate/cardiolipin synthase family protein [Clostridia bacterium]|nr:phosphatidylserine/phosphatidylglycerophosphate/cardiolipin synthase family protein [Clostridia bacterium]
MTDARCTLLVDGREAFPAILEAIAAAKESVVINMFIWRDDAIGNRMARAVLEAADRGVSVQLSVDRYGAVLEKAEECRRSFFHKRQSPIERLKAHALSIFYREKTALPPQKDEESELYRAILTHPRIALDCDRHKADHSKFYIIDGRVLFLGGVNVEDKENGADREGRVYGDLMVRLDGEDIVRAFLDRRAGAPLDGELLFPMNLKEGGRFEMEEHYLSLIDAARERLLIVMAYLSPLPRFLDAIVRAQKRGVRVTVMIPSRANYQNDTNRKTVARLLALTDGGIEVRLSEKMLHTKLLATEGAISFGSTNITKKAFCQLDELNLTVKNADTPLCRALTDAMERELAAATPVGVGEVTYSRLRAFLEGFLV